MFKKKPLEFSYGFNTPRRPYLRIEKGNVWIRARVHALHRHGSTSQTNIRIDIHLWWVDGAYSVVRDSITWLGTYDVCRARLSQRNRKYVATRLKFTERPRDVSVLGKKKLSIKIDRRLSAYTT